MTPPRFICTKRARPGMLLDASRAWPHVVVVVPQPSQRELLISALMDAQTSRTYGSYCLHWVAAGMFTLPNDRSIRVVKSLTEAEQYKASVIFEDNI